MTLVTAKQTKGMFRSKNRCKSHRGRKVAIFGAHSVNKCISRAGAIQPIRLETLRRQQGHPACLPKHPWFLLVLVAAGVVGHHGVLPLRERPQDCCDSGRWAATSACKQGNRSTGTRMRDLSAYKVNKANYGRSRSKEQAMEPRCSAEFLRRTKDPGSVERTRLVSSPWLFLLSSHTNSPISTYLRTLGMEMDRQTADECSL